LQKIEEEYKEKGVRVIGLVVEDDKLDAKKVLDEQGANYTNIVINDTLNKYLRKFSYVPTTMFVDSKGEFAREYIVGSKTYEEFVKLIEDVLE
jgi:hypothetical protein